MLWAAVTASGIGFLLGLRSRVRALIAASLALVVLSSAVALFRQQPVLTSLALTYAFLAALQGGYLVGVAVSFAWPRFKRRRQKDLGVGRSSKQSFDTDARHGARPYASQTTATKKAIARST